MTRLLPCVLLVFVTAIASAAEPAKNADGGKALFNGKDLTGWNGDSRLWSVKDGVIHGETTADAKANGNTFLIWDGEVSDFELNLEFRSNATNNSGVQYRSKHITEAKVRNDWVVRGYQHEIRNEENLPNVSGFIYDEGGRRGRICLVGEKAEWTAKGKQLDKQKLITADEYKNVFELDGWNKITIRAEGNHIQHFMNGKLVLDFTDSHPELALKSGVLALQLHAGKPMWVEFRNIQLNKID